MATIEIGKLVRMNQLYAVNLESDEEHKSIKFGLFFVESVDDKENILEVSKVLEGEFKWDRCCNFETEGIAHTCGIDGWMQFCEAMQRIGNYAKDELRRLTNHD